MATRNRSARAAPDLRLLHYIDVYHIELVRLQCAEHRRTDNDRSGSAEPVGGIAHFQTDVNEYRWGEQYANQLSLVTLFSGDVFNPSLESSVTKGRHMVAFLDAIGTNVACVGVRTVPS